MATRLALADDQACRGEECLGHYNFRRRVAGIADRVGDEEARSRRERPHAAGRSVARGEPFAAELRTRLAREDEVTGAIGLPDGGKARLGDLERGLADLRAGVAVRRQRACRLSDGGERALVLGEGLRLLARGPGLRSLLAHERLHRKADDRGHTGPEDRATPVTGRIALRVADQERKYEQCGPDADPDSDLRATEVQRDPDHRQQREGRVTRCGAVVRVTKAGHDDEVRKRGDDVGPAWQPRPGDEEAGSGDDDREDGRDPDVCPVLGTWRKQRGEHREQAHGCEWQKPPRNLRVERLGVGCQSDVSAQIERALAKGCHRRIVGHQQGGGRRHHRRVAKGGSLAAQHRGGLRHFQFIVVVEGRCRDHHAVGLQHRRLDGRHDRAVADLQRVDAAEVAVRTRAGPDREAQDVAERRARAAEAGCADVREVVADDVDVILVQAQA